MNRTFELTLRIGEDVTVIAAGGLGEKSLNVEDREDRELIAAMVAMWVEAP